MLKNTLFRRLRSRLTGNNGWILIDSMVGILIIALAIVALLGTYTMMTKSVNLSTNRTQAVYLAQQSLETLKRFDGTAQMPDTNDSQLPAVPQPFTRQLTRTQTGTNLSLVTATVTWRDQSSTQTNTVTMSSVYYQQ